MFKGCWEGAMERLEDRGWIINHVGFLRRWKWLDPEHMEGIGEEKKGSALLSWEGRRKDVCTCQGVVAES